MSKQKKNRAQERERRIRKACQEGRDSGRRKGYAEGLAAAHTELLKEMMARCRREVEVAHAVDIQEAYDRGGRDAKQEAALCIACEKAGIRNTKVTARWLRDVRLVDFVSDFYSNVYYVGDGGHEVRVLDGYDELHRSRFLFTPTACPPPEAAKLETLVAAIMYRNGVVCGSIAGDAHTDIYDLLQTISFRTFDRSFDWLSDEDSRRVLDDFLTTIVNQGLGRPRSEMLGSRPWLVGLSAEKRKLLTQPWLTVLPHVKTLQPYALMLGIGGTSSNARALEDLLLIDPDAYADLPQHIANTLRKGLDSLGFSLWVDEQNGVSRSKIRVIDW